MSAAIVRSSRWLYAAYAGTAAAWLATAASIVFHVPLKTSGLMNLVALLGLAAAVLGIVGGLQLASARRNVMWILAVAVAVTAAMALLAAALTPVGA
jgi:multidrug transporter EmrE-like cation transporter